MSTEALNKIIKEVKALTPDERRELIERLGRELQDSPERVLRRPGTLKGTVKYMAPDFDESVLPNLETTEDTAALGKWLNEARNVRAELPLTSDSVNILRELREARSRQ